MAETDAERYRQEAEECRKLAARAMSLHDKDAWLSLAADWMKLAENAAERRLRLFGDE
ncbi:hypothetical protein [Bradyrhizobium australiense]|uniref:Uncharacterized protein n=1 Tax=Bradyrhizobium australiense TaxID=2721161 RepID=A0A7Y4GW17_9BRAD|nr:hypothetical protein [Bradyrhizobium australiense]NOJ43030.1 hypothetical protein [Bradyrhizobium australiense]